MTTLVRRSGPLKENDVSSTTEPFEIIDLLKLAAIGQDQLAIETTFTYDNLPLTCPVQVKAKLYRTNTGARVKGHYHTVAEEPCDRCSEPFTRELDESFEESVMFHAMAYPKGLENLNIKANKEIELQPDDFYDVLDANECLNLKELIYQLIILMTSTDRFCNRPECQCEVDDPLEE